MKKGIHPEYKKARITCGCGNQIETKNTVGDLTVEICSNCHPFFTGKQKLVDSAGRVDKFKARMETAEKLKSSKKTNKEVKKSDSNKASTDAQATQDKSPDKEVESAEELQKELEEETLFHKDASGGQAVDIKPEEPTNKK